jgi:hypothetical protein
VRCASLLGKKQTGGSRRVMGRHFCSTRVSLAAFATGLIACAASLALADDARYCVTCKNPDQTYVCHVTGESARPNDALKLYCVIRTAKEGNHASCSAERSDASCRGIEKVYSYDGPMIPDIASDPGVQTFTDKEGHDQRAFEKPKGEAPQTMVELGGRAVSASRQGLRNARAALGSSSDASQPLPVSPQTTGSTEAAAAGESPEPPRASRVQRASSAVGGFARKSYRCLRSLFRNCSGETASDQAIR